VDCPIAGDYHQRRAGDQLRVWPAAGADFGALIAGNLVLARLTSRKTVRR
jgi:hypothetical protein